MKYIKKLEFSFLCALASLNALGQTENAKFLEIYDLIEKHNFFKAKEIYNVDKDNFPLVYQKFTEAILDNAFNQLNESQEKITFLYSEKLNIPDSLQLKLYEIRKDNAVKLYNYKEAKNAVVIILSEYREYLTSKEIADFENDLKIWSALENIPPQKVYINQRTRLKMEKDNAGLNNLKVTANQDTLNFIFDTGANLSTTSKSVAKRLKMKLISVDIEVGSITGAKVLAQLALCDTLKMGNIDMHNLIFLVLPDDALAFPQINYQINGILGFPVIEALNEIQITQHGDFIVPKQESTFSGSSNMAMNELTPLIYIDEMHFTFDTGADQTLFYNSFYLENQDDVNKQYQPGKIRFGGAGGSVEFEGYVINHTFNNLGKQITLQDIQLLKEEIKENETVYGNIGQDLIRQFNTMTLNFDQMYIKFE
jgi:predicted aspartyl protease